MLLDTEVDLGAISKVADVEITDGILRDICHTKDDVLILNMKSCHALTDLGLASVGKHWKKLQKLLITDCPMITHVGLRSVALNCRDLRSILLDDVDDAGLRIIAANLIRLEHIDLSSCRKVTDRGLSEVAHCCRKLKTMNLSGCYKIGESGIWGLCELLHCQELDALDLSGCTYLGDKGLWAVAKRCPGLKKLHVSNCPYLSGRVMGKIPTIMEKLIDLAVSKTCKDWSSEDIISIIDSCKGRIQRIDFSFSFYLGKKEIEMICRCPTLVELKLAGCQQVGDDEVFMIEKNLPELVSLDLCGCDVSESSVEVLAPKEGGIGLSYLCLTGCDLVCPINLQKMASNYLFSKLVADDSFLGYQPLPSETELRNDARISHQQLLASIYIQRMIRGMLVRMGIYREKREKSIVEHGIRQVQAHFRRRKQMVLTRNISKAKAEKAAVNKIKAALQYYRWNQYCKKRLKEHQLYRKRIKFARVIQRYYRGHLGRILASDQKYFVEVEKYRAKKQNAKRQQAAIDMQTVARGLIARTKVKRIRAHKEAAIRLQRLKTSSSISIQRVVRGFASREVAKKLRFERDLAKKNWNCAHQIQCAWRGFRSLQRLAQLRYFKQIEIHEDKARILQSLWRSILARRQFILLKALRDLMDREIQSSAIIQRLYRGMRGRKEANSMKAVIVQQMVRNNAAILLQRVCRGFVSRRVALKMSKLKSIDWKLKPVRDKINKIDANLQSLDIALQVVKADFEYKDNKLEYLEKELSIVSESRKTFVDSVVINGVLQRCSRALVKSTLEKEIEGIEMSMEKCHAYEEKLIDESRTLRSEKRDLFHRIEQMTAEVLCQKLK